MKDLKSLIDLDEEDNAVQAVYIACFLGLCALAAIVSLVHWAVTKIAM